MDDVDTTNGLNLPISVANEAFSSAEVSNALENMNSNKSYVAKKDGKTYSIQPTKDGSKNVVIEIDGKRNEIKEVRLSANSDALKMLKNGGAVVPKNVSDRLISTKAINLSTGNPLSVFLVNPAEKDNSFTEGKNSGFFSFSLGSENYLERGNYYIDSDNHLYASKIKDELTFDKVVSSLGVNSSLSKTFDSKLKQGWRPTFECLTAMTGERKWGKIIQKMGYDAFVSDDGSDNKIYVSDASMLITKGTEEHAREKEQKEGPTLRANKHTRDNDERSVVRGRDGGGIPKSLEVFKGKSIAKSTKERLAYVREVERTGAFTTPKEITEKEGRNIYLPRKNLNLKVIREDCLTDDLKAISDRAKSIEARVYFIARSVSEDDCYAYYLMDSSSIFVHADTLANDDLEKTYIHEEGHFLDHEWFMEYNIATKLDILNILENREGSKEFYDEISQLFQIHYAMYFEKDYDESTYDFYEIDDYDAEYVAEELRNNLYARNINLISEEGIIFQEKLIEDIDNFKSKGRETAAKNAYDEVFNDEDDEIEYGERKLQAKIRQNKGKLTNWVNTEPTEKAKAFIEANKSKEPKKVGVFIANEGFETTETEITIRKSEDGKWEVTAYDKFTGKMVKSKRSGE